MKKEIHSRIYPNRLVRNGKGGGDHLTTNIFHASAHKNDSVLSLEFSVLTAMIDMWEESRTV